jgi:hypothetical protein
MDKLFAEKFLIGDTDSQDFTGQSYDGSGINPSGGSINPKDVIATDPDQSDIKSDSPVKADPNYKPTEDGDGEEVTEDAASYIPFLALGLVAAFLFIKFGKK